MKQFNDDTKTSVASLLARPFDPLGLISPYILLARKQTFEDKLGWKEKLQGPLLGQWQHWISLLPELADVTYPRHVPFRENSEIHIFGDAAANMGHGVAAYVRTYLIESDRYETHLLMAKSRINPMKDITVPRLELVAALLCAQTAEMLHRELDFDKKRIFATLTPKRHFGGKPSRPRRCYLSSLTESKRLLNLVISSDTSAPTSTWQI